MRIVFLLMALSGLLIAGCAKNKATVAESVDSTTREPAGLSALAVHGRVSMVNPQAGFAVVTFPIGSVAGSDQILGVYREGTKVADLRVTGPRRDNNTVADILSGEVRVNDEVRLVSR